jgi:hypothetical protein
LSLCVYVSLCVCVCVCAMCVMLFRLEDLRRRFEAPNESNRWDKPLFLVNTMAPVPTSHEYSSSDSTTCSQLVDEIKGSSINIGETVTDTADDCVDNKPLTLTPPVSTLEGSDTVVQGGESDDESFAPHTTVFSSWKSSKSKRKPSDDASVSTQQTTSSSSSCFVKKLSGSSSVYFSGNQAVDKVHLTDEGPDIAMQKICDYFRTAEAPQPNAATSNIRHSSANLLYQLDKVSQTITQHIILHQQNQQSPGTPLVFKEYNSFSLMLPPRHVSMAELQRHRRQFIKVNSQHPPEHAEDIGKHFLEFLSHQY